MSESSPLIEPLPGDQRLTTLPISRNEIWQRYKKASQSFWTVEEVDLSTDRSDYENRLNEGEKKFVDYVLAFFAALDKMVNMNITKRFKEEFNIFEIDAFYDFQVAIENVHSEMYSLLLDTIIVNKDKKQHLLNSIQEINVIKKMGKWVEECINSHANMGERLIRMCCVEGVFFIGAFCAIYWLQDRGLMKGLGQSNESIARDESMHTEFSILLYQMLIPEHKLSESQIIQIFEDAVQVASEFITEALPDNLSEMNSFLMIKYIECSVDNLLVLLGLKPHYQSKNPFHFMEKLNLRNRTNFFERRVTEYQKNPESNKKEFELADEW